jgi:hypothetical protein
MERVLQALQLLPEFRAEPRLPCLHGGARMPLALGEQEILWNVMDGFDPHPLQFLDGACVD